MVTNRPRFVTSPIAAFSVLVGALALVGCSSGSSGSGTGGSPGTGGSHQTGSGGSSTGGSTPTGGTTTGGSPGSGGNTGTGGVPATGGVTGTGGSTGGAAGSVTAGTGGAAGAAGRSGGTGGGGGGATGGSGGTTNCAGHAISFNANVGANSDPAKAAVLVNFSGSADLPTGNASRTIEFWAYLPTTAWSADANTMFFYGSNNRNNDGFGLDFGNSTSANIGTIDPFTNGSTDPQGDNKPSGLMANMAQWAHFAMTWDGTTLHAYVNGVEKVSVPIPGMLHTGMSTLTIGGYPPAYFNGQIDEFRVWNVARSAAEIMSTMNHTLTGNEAGLTGYWKFDETSGAMAADSVSSAGHTAHVGMLSANTASNNPTWVASTAPLTCP